VALRARPIPSLDPVTAGKVVALCLSPLAQEAAAAIGAVAGYPELEADASLEELAYCDQPWLAGLALDALASRGAEQTRDIIQEWSGSEEVWRRGAAARAVARLVEAQAVSAAGRPDLEPLQARLLEDPEPVVRLEWLEAISTDHVPAVASILNEMLVSDQDPAVRAQCLSMLGTAGLLPPPAGLINLHRSWVGDDLGDARAEALIALAGLIESAAETDVTLEMVRDLALGDADAAVRARVLPDLRSRGVAVEVQRRATESLEWYVDLAEWRDRRHWLDLVTARGTVRVALDTENAPITCRRIMDLAEQGFYEGLTFHRVVPNFVVQGGDPRGDGWGGPGFVLPDEPSLRSFDVGAVGIATAGPGTGGCQLFMMLLPASRLAAHYTRFGTVVDGLELIERIQVGDRIIRVESLTTTGEQPPPPAPTLTGRLTWEDLAGIDGWSEERAAYEPDPGAISVLRTAGSRYRAVSVLGTWCSDSRREIPRLEAIVAETGGVLEHVMIGVDRTKRTHDPALPEGALVDGVADLVPTIIFYDEYDQELGRVVETAEAPLETLLLELIGPWEGW
jgi:peptidylprolyl isomerase/peptidyl-prolyl cis-trans isomerase B (cyclophilin B)